MTIINGQVADADEVMNAMGSLFNDTAQNLFNAAYIGFDSSLGSDGAPDLKNIEYDIFTTDTMNITGNVFYDATNDYYFGGDFDNVADYVVYDDCDNSSIDTALWTTYAVITNSGQSFTDASISENGSSMNGVINVGWDNSSGSTYAQSKEITLASYSMLQFNANMSSNSSNDRTTSGTIKYGGQTMYTGTGATVTGLKFQIIKINSIYYYRMYNATWGSWTIFVPSTEVLEIRINASSGSNTGVAGATFAISDVRYNTGTSGTGYILSTVEDVGETITNLIPIRNGTSSKFEVSVDNGSNYEEATSSEILRPTNTGQNLITKFTFSTLGYLSEYAIKYNLY